MTYPLTRKEAIFRGMTLYKTGIPCKHGHVEKRYVAGGACVKCAKLYQREHHKTLGIERRRIAKIEAIAEQNHLDRQFERHRKRTGDALAKPPEPMVAVRDAQDDPYPA